MEKNKYLIINDLIYDLYQWKKLEDIEENFFQLLKLVVPFSYASVLLKTEKNTDSNKIPLSILSCFPSEFKEAEEKYLSYEDVDDLGWNLYARESKVIRESDIVDENKRFNSAMYNDCYKKYDIYDNLQLTICFNNKLYGVLTLFSTKDYGAYSAEDMFFLRSIGMHINAVISRLYEKHTQESITSIDFLSNYTFTSKEKEIIHQLLQFEDNSVIAKSLNISEHTLQKHLQNIFRKFKVNSKWEFMRKLNHLEKIVD